MGGKGYCETLTEVGVGGIWEELDLFGLLGFSAQIFGITASIVYVYLLKVNSILIFFPRFFGKHVQKASYLP